MSEDTSPHPLTEHDGDGQEPDGHRPRLTIHGRRKAVIAAAIVLALAALLLCVSSLFSGCSPVSLTSQGSVDSAGEAAQDMKDAQELVNGTCEHDWSVTYKTVHHDAVTHTETIEPDYDDETTYHTVCNDCEQVIDGVADQHIKETGHSGYSTNVPITNEVLVSEGYTQEVVDTPAYDETVADALVCTLCGETRPLTDTAE